MNCIRSTSLTNTICLRDIPYDCEFKGTALTYSHNSSIYADDIIYLINDDNSKAFIVGKEGDAYSNKFFVDQ